jgi:hypothetical protein
MVTDWLELCSGGVPISIGLKGSLDDLRTIAANAPTEKGINRQLELCLVGLVSYFEAFCKDLFAFAINRFPCLLHRLDGAKLDLSIDASLALELGDQIRDKVGFIIAERIDFGTPSSINHHYHSLLKISPFSKDEMRTYADILRDRHVLVHHGGACTFWYVRQFVGEGRRDLSDAHWHSVVVDLSGYREKHAFVEGIARKMLIAAHRSLSDYAEREYKIQADGAIESLLWWEPEEIGNSKPDVPAAVPPSETGDTPF